MIRNDEILRRFDYKEEALTRIMTELSEFCSIECWNHPAGKQSKQSVSFSVPFLLKLILS